MLKRIVGLALIAAAGLLVWLWLRRHQDDFATMNTQFAPPDLSRQIPASPAAIAVSAAPNETEAQATQPELPPGDQAPPQAEPPSTPEELDVLFEDSEAPHPPPAPATDELPPVVALPPATTGEDSADVTPASEEPARPAGDTANEAAADTNGDDLDNVTGYCVRCKTKREIVDAHEETTESGRRAARGTCPVCGANMFTFLKEEPEDDQHSG